MAGTIQKQRYVVLTVGGVAAIGGIATLAGDMPLSVRIWASVVFLILVAASTAYNLHLVSASAKDREQSAAAQSARDKLEARHHKEAKESREVLDKVKEVLDKIQAQDITGAIELLGTISADLAYQVGAAPEDWSVSSPVEVADMRVLDRDLRRYAVVPNVTITNRSRSRISLSAALCVQWGKPSIIYNVANIHGMPLAHWDDILLAFGIDRQQQLLFPLNIAGEQSVCGNVVFDIPNAGIGVEATDSLMGVMGGFSDADEHEQERDCKLTVRDEITLHHHDSAVSTVYAPPLGGAGVKIRSDLAVAGQAETYVIRDE